MISDAQISKALVPYGVSAHADLCERIRRYISLLLLWNRKVSLTTVTDQEKILKFHFGESFFASKAVPIEHGRLADVGSGAGFPGIPLAMLCPDLEVTLIEVNLKKAAFLSEVIRTLNLTRVRSLRSRMEDVPSNLRGFDFITARALGHHEELICWAQSFLAASAGKVVLWIGESDAATIARNPAWVWRDPIHIPSSRNRCLLIGSPKR